MGMRIATIQIRDRELGRLRGGTFNGKNPVRSKTWIFTSPYENQVRAAAALWGGTVEAYQPQGSGPPQFRVITAAEAIEAILPAEDVNGDTLNSSFEMWSKGGIQRRCNGVTESESGQPCLCRAAWGDAFHAVAPKDAACKITTRFSVILPQMPDLGLYRLETKSYFATSEITAAVEMIRAAVGTQRFVPIALRIEPRTRVSKGQTKKFPVVAVELRGATAGQLLAATMANNGELAAHTRRQIGAGQRALESGRPDYRALADDAVSADEITALWNQALDAGHLDDELKGYLAPIGQRLRAAETGSDTASPAVEDPDEQSNTDGDGSCDGDCEDPDACPDCGVGGGEQPVDAEIVDEEASNRLDELWARLLENAPDGWGVARLEREYAQRNDGRALSGASEAEMGAFLQWLQNGGAQ